MDMEIPAQPTPEIERDVDEIMSEKDTAELLDKIRASAELSVMFDMRDIGEMMLGQTFAAMYGNLVGMLFEEGVEDPFWVLDQAGILEGVEPPAKDEEEFDRYDYGEDEL